MPCEHLDSFCLLPTPREYMGVISLTEIQSLSNVWVWLSWHLTGYCTSHATMPVRLCGFSLTSSCTLNTVKVKIGSNHQVFIWPTGISLNVLNLRFERLVFPIDRIGLSQLTESFVYCNTSFCLMLCILLKCLFLEVVFSERGFNFEGFVAKVVGCYFSGTVLHKTSFLLTVRFQHKCA